jgi:hypothetical protein
LASFTAAIMPGERYLLYEVSRRPPTDAPVPVGRP